MIINVGQRWVGALKVHARVANKPLCAELKVINAGLNVTGNGLFSQVKDFRYWDKKIKVDHNDS